MQPNKIIIRKAENKDIAALMQMIKELAIYEKMEDMLRIKDDFIRDEVLRPDSPLSCLVAEDQDGKLHGYAALYQTMSLFLGQYGLHIHDLYVRESARGQGLGKAFMIEIARIALDKNYGRISWEALAWNTSAIDFYKKLGAEHQQGWDMFKVEGGAITALAQINNSVSA